MNQDQQKTENVREFVNQVASRLNRHRFLNVCLWATLLAGLTMLVISLFYIVPGYAVPKIWYAIVFGTAAVSALAWWALNRVSNKQAAAYSDQHFSLKDSVWSCLNFAEQGKSGDFFQLQAKQTGEKIQQQQIESIKYRPAYYIAFLALLLVMISVALGFKPAAQHIVELQKQQKQTLQLTAAANEDLRDMVRELEDSLESEEERKLVNPDKLRKWVDELSETKDRKEAMRQYARLEMKLNRAAELLRQRNAERLLDAAALELKKEELSKEFGKKIEQKKYKQAANDLKKMKPEKLDPKKFKKLSEQRKQLAKLKAIANRMADAARNTKKASSRDLKASKGKHRADDSASADDLADDDASDISDALEELEEELEELDEKMEIAELADKDDREDAEERLEECEECKDGIGAKLDELGDKLIRLARKRAASQKLKKLSQRCSQCQAMAIARSRGGKKAGKGSVDSKREDDNKKQINNQQYTRLKGIKGKGKSLVKTENASSGSGVSGRKHAAKKRDFKRQFESFVGREDIPEDLKSGVKNYFSNIHQKEEKKAAGKTEPKPSRQKK